jgi:membrane protease YdiL (CAAX protease family)
MTATAISPAQAAFLLWSAVFFGAAAARAAASSLGLAAPASLAMAMFLPFVLDGAVVIGIPRLRRAARELLRRPIPRASYGEVALIACVATLAQPARFAGFALMAWMQGGDPAVVALGDRSGFDRVDASSSAALIHLALTCLFAPLVEELMYRGFLFPLWAQRRSLVTAIVLSSLVFGAGHPNYVHAFAIGVLLASLYLRTGALRAAILVHFVANFTTQALVLGRFARPAENQGLSSWSAHITALILFAALTLGYLLFAARNPAPDASAQARSR